MDMLQFKPGWNEKTCSTTVPLQLATLICSQSRFGCAVEIIAEQSTPDPRTVLGNGVTQQSSTGHNGKSVLPEFLCMARELCLMACLRARDAAESPTPAGPT